ncbi:MAG: class I SAM-dependent methyltransferase [Bacteroidetes bacterium]|nr:class I SAM-dependent methyltransferase [Bacteroidota bacterium]
MKIRDSGMPEETYWETFFNPQYIFSQLQLDNKINDAAEFGSGYGTFTIPAAKIIKGNLHAFDIEPEMISILKEKLSKEKISNVKVHQADFVKEGTKLRDESVDYAILFNILHAENPVSLLKEAYRILKHNGKAGIIHWIYSDATPRGPSLDIRPKPEQCIEWLKQSGFKLGSEVIQLPPYHYGIVGVKR